MSKKMTTLEFLEKIKNSGNWNDEYDYSNVVYDGAHKKITIICPVHGKFEQSATHCLSGGKCGRCAGKRKLTSKEIIEDFINTHGDKYDYSLVDYKSNHIKGSYLSSRQFVWFSRDNHSTGPY